MDKFLCKEYNLEIPVAYCVICPTKDECEQRKEELKKVIKNV